MEKETALKILRERHDNALFSERAALETLIPELAESEDEQIRKEIQSVIKQLDKDTTICGNKYDYSQWIAWLEKQGEQKTSWSEVDEKMREKLLFLMEEENSIESWGGCYEWLQNLKF